MSRNMTAIDALSNGLTTLMNNEFRNKTSCVITPASKPLGRVLRVLQLNGYVGEFEFVEDGRSGKFRVQLLGRINKCGAIKPRYSVKADGFESWEKTYLPAREMGILVVSTSSGVVSHKEAKQKSVGGKLLAFVY
jgi:small subunit ribosomal protein S8